MEGKLVTINIDECIECSACVDICPNDAIIEDDVLHIDQDLCMNCPDPACALVCPADAIIQENNDDE